MIPLQTLEYAIPFLQRVERNGSPFFRDGQAPGPFSFRCSQGQRRCSVLGRSNDVMSEISQGERKKGEKHATK